MKPNALPSQDILNSRFRYNQTTGKLYYAGTHTECEGTRNNKGYLQISVNGIKYLKHRIIYKMVTGEDPTVIDHKDHNPKNNKWNNLRNCSTNQNLQNRKPMKNNKLGISGVTAKRDKFVATIQDKYLGIFDNLNDAVKARQKAEKEIFGKFTYKKKV